MREIKNLSLRDLAKQTEISSATLSRLENANLPDVTTFIRICDWLGKPMDIYVTSKREMIEQEIKEFNEKIDRLISERDNLKALINI